MEAVAARLDDLEYIVGSQPPPLPHPTTPIGVARQLVDGVESSGDIQQMQALSEFCWEYLQEFDLGIYICSRKLDVQLETLAPNHPDVASTRASMADHLKEQGKFEEAEAMLDTVLADRLRSLEPNHIDVGITYRELGNVYKSECRYDEALVSVTSAVRLHPAVSVVFVVL